VLESEAGADWVWGGAVAGDLRKPPERRLQAGLPAPQKKEEEIMSIAGYLSPSRVNLRLPEKGVDELGIRFEGAAGTGEEAVREKKPGDEYYDAPEDYDPVLRAHCRL
jgi:hypothetical protein